MVRRGGHDVLGARPVAPRATLAAVCLAVAALMLNVTGPAVALSAIAAGTGASFSALQWVISAYALCLAVFQLGAGRIADLVGRRRTFLVALGCFLAASLVCTLAPSAFVLVVGRALQGAAAAAVTASSLALLAHELRGRERARAIGIWGGTLAVSFGLGPIVGGLLVDVFGWRAIFAAGIVPGGLALALAARFAHESRDPAAQRLDLPGMATLALALFGLLFAVLRGNALGWVAAPVLGAAGLGALLLAVFVLVERGRPAPMLDLSLFSIPTFSGTSLLVWLMAFANFGAFVYLSYFLLVALGRTPLEAGLQLAPAPAATALVSMFASRLLYDVPLRLRFAGGQLLLAAGLLYLSQVDLSSWAALAPGLCLTGAGIGFTNPLSAQAHLAVLPPEHAGLASGINNTARQLGVALGTAALGALLEALLHDGQPYASALADVLLTAAAIAALGIVVALVLVRESDLHARASSA